VSLRALPNVADRLALFVLRRMGFRRRFVETNVGRMHTLLGDGGGRLPKMVLLHGFSSAGVHYLPLIRRLQPVVQGLCCPDLAGHGFSSTPERGLDAETLRTSLFETLDAVIDEPVVLLGNSMGGLAAIHYARERPDRVRGLILLSPGGAMMETHEIEELGRTFEVHTHREALEFVDRLLARPSPIRTLMALGIRASFGKPALQQLIQSIRQEDLLTPEDLGSLTMPSLLMWGKDERILPHSSFAFFRDHLPDHIKVIEPEGFGHSPFLDDPDRLFHIVLGFLADIESHTAGDWNDWEPLSA
jgi:pimeloyl-ACP methyl ester carboxylesterase